MGRPGTLRIISGSAGGLRLAYPKEVKIRPTADRVREAVFNILAGRADDARVLDLFAGTGAYGLEALSRGARRCTFVEKHHACVAAIRDNLQKTHLAENAVVVSADAFAFVDRELPASEPFDLIFIDPPYRFSQDSSAGSKMAKLMAGLATPGVLAAEGIIILEHASTAAVSEQIGPLRCYDRRNYGTTAVSFFGLASMDAA